MNRSTIAILMIGIAVAISQPALADELKTLSLDLGNSVKLDTVLVPAGEFQMGAPDAEPERQDCETPVHKVKISKPFYLGKFEVTNAQMRAFRPDWHSRYYDPAVAMTDQEKLHRLDADNQPALFVSWYDADAFCRWASAKLNKTVRLPTEAEWEYACRAGNPGRFCNSPAKDNLKGAMDSADLVKVACYGGNSHGLPSEVGKFAPNAFGLYDMHGNAWEWCSDWFADDYYKTSPDTDPAGPETGKAKILRGGSYFYWIWHYCRSAMRYRLDPTRREPVTGFRVLVEDGPKRDIPAAGTRPWPAPRQNQPLIAPPDFKAADVAAKFGGPAVFIPRALGAPTIDGKLDDESWNGSSMQILRFMDGRAGIPTAATISRLMADDKALYVGFSCLELEMDRLSIKGAKHNDPVWQGDDVEVFLDPNNTRKLSDCYHIAINPSGVTMTAKGVDPSWNPNLKVATIKALVGWTVELAIPWADLGIADGQVPKVMGLNLTRYRPELGGDKPKHGKLVPHSWPVDRPEILRQAEDTAWAPTLSENSFTPTRFGHVLLEAGAKEVAPPAKLFELIAKDDFADGTKGKFTAGEVVDGGYMGVGKALHFKPKEVAQWQVPVAPLRDANLLLIVKATPEQLIYWHTYSKLFGSEKCCCRQVTTLTRDPVRLPPWFNYCHGAGRIDFTSNGVAGDYYAGFKKHLLWHSEPTIGHIGYAGPEHWAIVYTRAGELRTQHPHNTNVDMDKDSIAGWTLHAGGDYDLYIAGAVMFNGVDNQGPEKVKNVKVKAEGDKVAFSWDKAADNTFTVWYKLTAGEGNDAAVVGESPELSITLPADKVKGKKVRVAGVDFFENVGEASDAVEVK